VRCRSCDGRLLDLSRIICQRCKDIRDVLRAALASAVAEELLTRNVAAIVRLPNPRRPQRQWWSVEEERTFLESARRDNDPLYAAPMC
jgi:hypothetical protein